MEFLGLRFYSGSQIALLEEIKRAAGLEYSFLVTPNIDHLNLLSGNDARGSLMRECYGSARYIVCDSRVLQAIARILGRNIFTYPGSDIVKDLLESGETRGLRIGVVGPSPSAFGVLAARYQDHEFTFIPSHQAMAIGSDEFNQCLKETAIADWDVLVVGFGAPKQEVFAKLLGAQRQSGVALCAGASIDFLTSRQTRAPLLLQRMRLEWLFRLLSDPKRMWRRYILGAPKFVRTLFTGIELNRNDEAE